MSNPYIEYYILENYGSWNPTAGGSLKGTVVTDGGVYDIVVYVRWGSIVSSITTIYNVRREKRTQGTVTMRAHAEAWQRLGVTMGSKWEHQLVACEGYYSQGFCEVEVSGGEITPPVSSSISSVSTSTTSSSSSSSRPSSSSPTSTSTSRSSSSSTSTSSSSSPTQTCVPKWGQCGGLSYSGSTCCQPGSTCVYSNDWYVDQLQLC